MAATELDVTPFARAGVGLAASSVAANADGNFFDNTGKEVLAVTNASGGPVNVTIESTIQVDGQTVADRVVSCPDAVTTFIGPFPIGCYNDDTDEVNVTYADETDLTVAVFKLTPGV